nr:9129_t:CDS:10 [Entrophospora candida]
MPIESFEIKKEISNADDAYQLNCDKNIDLDNSSSAETIQVSTPSDHFNDSNREESKLPAEKPLDQSVISEDEKKKNSEFFLGKRAKTPERYMKIRNFILNTWLNNKPKYISKTIVRPGLKDCGDVNAIGRVHAYLESIGAINVGFATKIRAVKRSSKRKLSDGSANSTDGSDDLTRRSKRIPYDYDPFRLVKPMHYTSRYPAPFKLSVSTNVMLMMDFHAHLAHTEIIGLLGGHFHSDSQLMEITYVYPCKSLSTGFQCEMDPESEVAAREVFSEKCLEFVGWYHSHPTFEPQPSIRDIENQSQYQEMWKRDDGLEPFIGVIVTPYDAENVSNISKFKFWMSGTKYDVSGEYRTPYECEHLVSRSESFPEDMFSQLSELIREYHNYDQRVDMAQKYRNNDNFLRLDKMMESLSSHLTSQIADSLISRLRELVNDNFISQEVSEVVNNNTNTNVEEP